MQGRKSQFDKEDIKEMRQMHKDGLSYANIAKHFKVNRSTIYYYIHTERLQASHKRWYLKNRDKAIEMMKRYDKRQKAIDK